TNGTVAPEGTGARCSCLAGAADALGACTPGVSAVAEMAASALGAPARAAATWSRRSSNIDDSFQSRQTRDCSADIPSYSFQVVRTAADVDPGSGEQVVVLPHGSAAGNPHVTAALHDVVDECPRVECIELDGIVRPRVEERVVVHAEVLSAAAAGDAQDHPDA